MLIVIILFYNIINEMKNLNINFNFIYNYLFIILYIIQIIILKQLYQFDNYL